MIDFKELGAKAAAEGANQTVSKAGGGDYEPPAAGPGTARLVGYIELGKQKGTFKGVATVKEKVVLLFELVGKRHPPVEKEDGTKLPSVIAVEESYSLNEKANFFKLFNRLNYKQDAVHMAQLLGAGFKVEVVHDTWKDKTGKERVTATLKNTGGYTISPPRKEDEDSESGWVDVAVGPALSPIRCFLWQQADLAQWATLFIDGEYPERKDDKGVVTAPAKSKNVYQNRIKSAVNFQGSPVHTLLLANGQSIDLPTVDDADEETAPEAPVPSAKAPEPDALGGIV